MPHYGETLNPISPSVDVDFDYIANVLAW